uniref:Protein-tyrosine phosphatase n=1 Tax=Ascaris lumbricoides TaxID=6252 RepID=A0A0M3HW88_ASCLU
YQLQVIIIYRIVCPACGGVRLSVRIRGISVVLTMPAGTKKMAKRRVHTRGRAECSVAADGGRRTVGRRVGAHVKVTVDGRVVNVQKIAEPRAPIATKFTRKLTEADKSLPSHKVSVPELWMDEVAALGIRGIRKEFVNDLKCYVPSGPQSAWECEKNYDKNRFEDIRLLDSTRVILRNTPDNEDYIHASYVKIDEDFMFICAQGPLKNTAQHFLIMIVQEGSKVVLQLCQAMEDGKEQCAEYIPLDGTECKDYGAVRVRVLEKPKHVLSLKKVVRTKLQITYAGVSHETEHILYSGWPDHGVPESVSVCKEVRNLVHKYAEKKPIVVHCSAGIGRTGAYVAVEMALYRLKRKEVVVMSELLKDLREQRMGAIQNDQQYLFVFRMVIEVLIAEDALVKDQRVIDFIKEYDDLIKRKRVERARKCKN